MGAEAVPVLGSLYCLYQHPGPPPSSTAGHRPPAQLAAVDTGWQLSSKLRPALLTMPTIILP